MNVVTMPSLKHCNGCQSNKPIEGNFWKGQSLCIECTKDRQKNRWDSRTPKKRLEQHLKYKYSLTIKQLNDSLEKQNGGCAICEEVLPDLLVYNNRRRGYAIDHNHETGEFRGILCLSCNTMLGMARDSQLLLEKASAYLKERGSYHETAAAARAGKRS